jgi:iron complex outermembrane recepter protein
VGCLLRLLSAEWDIAAGIRNITDATYYITANGTGGFVGDPRTFYVKADYRF